MSQLEFIAEQIAEVRAQVGDKKVLLALSGDVDSSVVAALFVKAIGKQLVCVLVNHGLLRKGEPEEVVKVFITLFMLTLSTVSSTNFRMLKTLKQREKLSATNLLMYSLKKQESSTE